MRVRNHPRQCHQLRPLRRDGVQTPRLPGVLMDWRDDLKLFAGCLVRLWMGLFILAVPCALAIWCRWMVIQDTGLWR